MQSVQQASCHHATALFQSDSERARRLRSVRRAWQMPLEAERVVDCDMGRQEPPRTPARFLKSWIFRSRRRMGRCNTRRGCCRAIDHDGGSRSGPTAQARHRKAKSLGNNDLRGDLPTIQQPTQQSESGAKVASFLHSHIHELAFVIDGAPDPHTLARQSSMRAHQEASEVSAVVSYVEDSPRCRDRTSLSTREPSRSSHQHRGAPPSPRHHAGSR